MPTPPQDQPNHNTPTDNNQSSQSQPISPVSNGPRAPRDVNNSPHDQTHYKLTSVETHTFLNTSTNNSAHSTSQHNSETKTSPTPIQVTNPYPMQPISHSTDIKTPLRNNIRWNKAPSNLRQAPQRPIQRSPNKTEHRTQKKTIKTLTE